MAQSLECAAFPSRTEVPVTALPPATTHELVAICRQGFQSRSHSQTFGRNRPRTDQIRPTQPMSGEMPINAKFGRLEQCAGPIPIGNQSSTPWRMPHKRLNVKLHAWKGACRGQHGPSWRYSKHGVALAWTTPPVMASGRAPCPSLDGIVNFKCTPTPGFRLKNNPTTQTQGIVDPFAPNNW